MKRQFIEWVKPTAAEASSVPGAPSRAGLAEGLALLGFALYSIFAPHSIAGAEIALSLVAFGWLVRLMRERRTGIRRSSVDLPILCFVVWTILSAVLSEEPRISLLKLQAVCVLLLFYLTRAFITRRRAVVLVVLMIASGVAGALWSGIEVARGRGVVIASLAPDSPFRMLPLATGDAVWRVGGHRISSVAEADDVIRQSPAGARLSVSAIKEGEHAEWPGFTVTEELKTRPSPSGITGAGPTHRFRASGWTRHYETFSETLQILAQLALGLGLANWLRGRSRWHVVLALAAASILAAGIILTAMRTLVLAFSVGAAVISWRATRGRARALVFASIVLLLTAGALVVWRTRAGRALELQDPSASLRLSVARTGLGRIGLHPLFGHGMDAVKSHWTEWGFPGTEVIHLHSTPLQIAFERGLPALLFWFWILLVFWRLAQRSEKEARSSADANRHGLLLGSTGALAGFFLSSLFNYNFGDAEVILVFWWLMGILLKCSQRQETAQFPQLTTTTQPPEAFAEDYPPTPTL